MTTGGSLSGLYPFPEPDILDDEAADDLLKSHMIKGTIHSLDSLSLVFSMFSEDDKHNLPKAAEFAKSARVNTIEAALAFKRAGKLLNGHRVRQDVKKHMTSFNLDERVREWIIKGIVTSESADSAKISERISLVRESRFGDMVLGYAAKFDLLAELLEWPVTNLLNNRFAFRDDMLKLFSMAAVIIHEASFLSQLFYEIPGKERENHMAWLEKCN